jgi:Uma2 family endonuclease
MHGTLHSVVAEFKAAVSLCYPVRTSPEAWVLPEGTVPESVPHDAAAERIKSVLVAWAARSPRPVWVARNLAIRWLEAQPSIGIDPDVCVLEPPPDAVQELASLYLWKPGHHPPPVCIEVVSAHHPHKDYVAIQDRYAAMGTQELIVFDPLLVGPHSLGGPVLLQLWRRNPVGVLERVHFGNTPAFSQVVEAWLVPDEGRLEFADDRAGEHRWLNIEGQERAEKERERAARTDLERRLADLQSSIGSRS